MTFACRVLDRQIRAELSLLDDGLSVLLAGGDKSHIGAVSVAEPDGRTQTVDFPGHREREVAKQWAAVLARSAAAGQRWSAVFTMMGLPVRAFSVC